MENVPKIKKKVNWAKIGIYKVVVLDELGFDLKFKVVFIIDSHIKSDHD
jgi:hypothetical protein